ncbi:hypothetical protein [Labrenzia sp. VG12]|uniref:hypothetical protein n=1 Tax=Labrenzia sp. VG12 TaxID=2021862 RepID=UPI000B8C154B|nr:hypothetical protein [Labrenzia sp. VG12]ASP32842.1 hypothetical protein CHH27_05935 [Labrenzia sp. VG12]
MSRYASLHAGLLARKGEASPALPSAFTGASYVDAPAPEPREPGERRDATGADLPDRALLLRKAPAIDAAGAATREPAYEPAQPAPAAQLLPSDAARGCCEGAEVTWPADPHAGIDRLHRVEARLTAEQKRRLLTVAVQSGHSQQRILSDALDAWLDALSAGDMKDCACLKARAPASR